MDNGETLDINVKIGERTFPLTIRPENEGEIRAAARLITETFEKYKEISRNKNYADLLAKASLHVLVEQSGRAKMQNTSDLTATLYEMEAEMEGFIDEHIS